MKPKSEHDAIQLLASGEKQEEIAEQLGVSQSTISRLAKKHSDAITREAERMVASLPDIISALQRDIITSNEISKKMADTMPSLNSVRSKLIEYERDWKLEGKDISELAKDHEWIKLKASERLNEEKFYSGFSLIFRDEPKMLAKFMELGYKKQSDVLRSVGILPATSQSIFVQNLVQNNNNTVINPVVLRTLGGFIAKSLEEGPDDDVTDAEVVE